MPAPVIIAPADLCAMSSATATVAPPEGGGEWASVTWEITNGTLYGPYGPVETVDGESANFSADASGLPVELRVRVIDSAGCVGQSTATVAIRTIPPAVITAPADLCPMGSAQASIAPPEGGPGWLGISWTIVNGSFQGPYGPQSTASGESVAFNSDGSNLPIELHVRAVDGDYCEAEGTRTVGIRTIAPPVITAAAEICPMGSGQASIAPPAEGGSWLGTSWTIVNGTFYGPYGPSNSAGGTTVTFRSDGSGFPVELRVRAADGAYCEAEATTTVAMRTIAPPVITAPADVCPMSSGTASIAPPAEGGSWLGTSWTIVNGTFHGPYGPSTSAGGTSVTFSPDESGLPVQLRVRAVDGDYCEAESSTTVALRTISGPVVIAPSSVCGSVVQNASVAESSNWIGIFWSITGGKFLTVYGEEETTGGAAVQFRPDGAAPVTLRVRAVDPSYCEGETTLVVANETPVPGIDVAPRPIPVGADATASVIQPEGSVYATYFWEIEGGTLQSSATEPTVVFRASGTEPVVLRSIVTNGNGCVGTTEERFLVEGNPLLIEAPDSFCSTAVSKVASLYAEGEITNVQWSITHGAINGASTASSVSFVPTGQGAVTLSVTALVNGVAASATKVIPYGVPALVVTPSSDTACKWRYTALDVANPELWSHIQYQIQGGHFASIGPGYDATFIADSDTTAVTVTLTAFTYDECPVVWTMTFETPLAPVMTVAQPSLCAGGTQTATFANAGEFQSWSWGIVNGTILTPLPTSNHPTTVTFRANGTAPVELHLFGYHGTTLCGVNVVRTFPVVAPPTPTITASAPQLCPGGNVTLTASNAASYLWSNGATTPSITVDAAGTYSVTVTADSGCQGSASATVTAATVTPAAITPSGPTTFCSGGEVTLTANEGTSYLWSTGATTQSIVVSESGSYSVTVTNDSGCSATSAATTVTVNPDPATPLITAGGATTFCAGGSVTLTAPAATSYLWSNGATTQSITATASGNYSVTVSNDSGCSATSAPTTVTVNALPPATITSGGPTTFCAGGGTTLSAPSGAYTYLWSTGATTRQLSVQTAGEYTVTVTNASGCSATSAPVTITVNTPPKPTITADGPTTFCPGGSVTLTASEGASYSWNTGQSTRSITVSPSSTTGYRVTVVDENGCSNVSDLFTVSVDGQSKPVIVGGQPSSCGTVYLYTSQSPGTTYLWSNGATTYDTTISESGTYTVTMTNSTGCSSTSEPFIFTRLEQPTATVSGGGSYCTSGSATIRATLTGNGPWTVTWSDGVTQSDITEPVVERVVSPASTTTYRVTSLRDANCAGFSSGQAVVQVNVPAKPTINTSGSTTFCEGSSVTLNTSNLSGYSYLWSNGATTSSISAYTSGTYTVTRTDPNGCSATSDPVIVTVHPKPSATVTADGPTTFCSGGSVTLSAPAGSSYLWSNGATTQAINVTSSGNYTVQVTNASGCSATSAATSVTVHPTPQTPTINASGATTFCEGGSVTLTAPAGYASYLWSNGATASSITISTSGSYSVTVTNGNGCSATSAATAVTVHPAAAPATVTASGPTTFCEGGSVTLTASGGQSFLWSTGATTQSITVGASGSYSVTVMNANGCSATSAATAVTVHPAAAPATITASGPTTFCEGGSVTLTASGGQSFLWSTGATTQSITISTSGSYSVTVTNANGCSATSAATAVTVHPAAAPATITASGPTTFCEGGSVTLTASGGQSFLWSTGATTQSITISTSGSYSVTVTNTNGCSATSAPAAIDVRPLPEAEISAPGTTLCEVGEVTLTATPAASYRSYLWSNGATTQSITVSTAGTYSVTVSDGFCSKTSAPVTIVDESTTVTITGSDNQLCPGEAVTVTSSVSGTAASYQWYGFSGQALPDETNPTLTITPSTIGTGYYFLRITTPAGCTIQSNVFVFQVTQPDATISANGPTTFCEGSLVELSAPDQPGYSYLWSTGETSRSITVGASGSYSVTVTNGNGCSGTSEPMTVTVHPNPARPTVTASGATTFCEGESVTLTAPGGHTFYLWSTGAITPSIEVTTSGSYSVTVTDDNGCTATSAVTTVTVTAKPVTPAITTSGGTTFCEGNSVTLTAPGGHTFYLWSNGATTPSINVTTSGSYSVTVTNAGGCSATSTATAVTVHPKPATPAITASGPTTFCAGGSVTLSAPAGFTYLWSNGSTDPSIVVTTSGSYSVTVTDANGCSSTSAATTVTVNANPSTPTVTAGGPTTFCAGGSVTLSAPAGYSYLWSNGSTDPSIVVTTSGSYSVTVTTAGGCSATSAATTVTVNPATSISQQPQSVTIGRNTTATLSVAASGTGTLTYQWYRGTSGNTSSPVSGATSFQYTTPRLNKGTYTYWVRVTSSCGVVNSSTATVSVP